ncbi:mitochondrial inner membrane protease atp23 [Pseudovirgaria hyperparasitica]|uniref:Mitochondrial inner membrane protease ATP23 n=1 Tax=Pseudovirgaria hyperparasitica TaxID=470096 RepID=A0A6A6WLL9_9PEZI|nr:mitochondrial inner membrane protease atp23 [Pseudovirgaria hyperparasitica]KAF2763062.1 mitochondrial inner membrane protease atp23 [Pseudovirgaria hyperparasitica]
MSTTTTDTPAPQQPASPPPSTPTDASQLNTYYTWSTFFNILLSRSTPTETASYFAARDLANEASDCARCTQTVTSLFKTSPIVRFLRDETRALSGGRHSEIGPAQIHCRRCTTRQSGGFDMDYGILLCANHLQSRAQTEDTLAHELVHAYDHLRFDVQRTDLRHQACTEIRASTLSGECRFTREFFGRRQWKVTQQLQECVRRRATLSLMHRPECKDEAHASRIVNEVWESCFRDTRPFDEIYR